MKRLAARAFWSCTALILLSLTGRLLWLASQTETGLQTLSLQWQDATSGWVVDRRIPIPLREPAEQAEFWLREVDRMPELLTGNAQMLMGAALVLDGPANEYVLPYVKKMAKSGRLPSPVFSKLNQGLERAENVFESKCKKRCLELASGATEIDPANVEWERLRALLLWRYAFFSHDRSPRDSNWLEILKQCAQHDSDNALYDYLAAHFYWETSTEMSYSGGQVQLVIKDAERFQRGVICFEQGQEKPFLAIGDAGSMAVADFLSQSTIPLTEQERIVNGRSIFVRRLRLVHGLWRRQRLRADELASSGDFHATLAMRRQNLHMLDQCVNADVSNTYGTMAIVLPVQTTTQMSALAAENEDSFSAEELREIKDLEKNARLESKVLEQAGREMAAGQSKILAIFSLTGDPATFLAGFSLVGGPATIIGAMIVGISPPLIVVLLLVGFTAIALSHLSRSRGLPTVGPWGQILSLVAACVATVVAFGLAPSGIISREVQAWVFTILLIALPIVLVLAVVWSWLRRRAFKFSLRAMLLSIYTLCILFGLVSAARPDADAFAQFPYELSIPSRGWEGLDARSLEAMFLPRYLFAIVQWTAYYGQYLTVAIGAVFLAALLHLKVRRANSEAESAAFAFRDRAGALFRLWGQSALKLSALSLLLYLVVAPNVVEKVEQNFQRQMAFARQPSSHWTKVEKLVRQVKSDKKRMTQLRAAVQGEMERGFSVQSPE